MSYPAIALQDLILGIDAALAEIIHKDEDATIPGGTLQEVLRNVAKAHPEPNVGNYLAHTLEKFEDDLGIL